MTNEELKQKMLSEIKYRTQSGVGARTTEVEDVWRRAIGAKKPSCGYNDGSPEADAYYRNFPERGLLKKLVLELHAEGKLKFFLGGGYCWMVPTGYEAYIGIKGQYVGQPVDLW